MIDLAAIRSLEAVHAHGSVIGAASALGFTPSAISQQIKRLEQQSGVGLLERVGRGVILTEQGRTLVEEGARVIAELERIETALHAQAGLVSGELSVIGFSTAMRGLIGPVTSSLMALHPSLRIRLQEVEPWAAVEQIAAGQADVAIVHRWGDVPIGIPDHLDRRTVHRDLADVIVPASHRLAARRVITPKDLVEERWIATPEGTICRQWLGRMYDGTGRLPLIEHTSLEFESHLALVSAGLGIALIPRLGRGELPSDTRAIRIKDPVPEREIIAVWRRTQDRSPAVRAIIEALGSQHRPKGISDLS
ncbi:MAG: DNA-binding transcriptional regulator, LysR family [Marmoricola sp.]|jgi:DNA-binding transcriptional LysR family regulator|nr:DNA-binding transcriptional regulator, LysR family [Marmoricola sp.]